MDFKMVFDPEVYRHVSAGFNVKIKSGSSLSVRNTLTALSMTLPKERQNLEALLKQQALEMSGNRTAQSLLHPDRVFYQPFAFWIEARNETVLFMIMFGLIVRGERRMGQVRGDFVIAVVARHETEDAARALYHTHKPIMLIEASPTLTE